MKNGKRRDPELAIEARMNGTKMVKVETDKTTN